MKVMDHGLGKNTPHEKNTNNGFWITSRIEKNYHRYNKKLSKWVTIGDLKYA